MAASDASDGSPEVLRKSHQNDVVNAGGWLSISSKQNPPRWSEPKTLSRESSCDPCTRTRNRTEQGDQAAEWLLFWPTPTVRSSARLARDHLRAVRTISCRNLWATEVVVVAVTHRAQLEYSNRSTTKRWRHLLETDANGHEQPEQILAGSSGLFT